MKIEELLGKKCYQLTWLAGDAVIQASEIHAVKVDVNGKLTYDLKVDSNVPLDSEVMIGVRESRVGFTVDEVLSKIKIREIK